MWGRMAVSMVMVMTIARRFISSVVSVNQQQCGRGSDSDLDAALAMGS